MNKNEKNNDAVSLHSITFYMSASKIDFFNKALKKVSNQKYGKGERNVSRYIRELLYIDLQKNGFLDSDFNPVEID